MFEIQEEYNFFCGIFFFGNKDHSTTSIVPAYYNRYNPSFTESFDDSSNMRPLRSTSTAGGQAGNDFDTSFDTSDILPNNNGRRSGSSVFDDDDDVVQILQGGKSPLPPSEAQDQLDNSLR